MFLFVLKYLIKLAINNLTGFRVNKLFEMLLKLFFLFFNSLKNNTKISFKNIIVGEFRKTSGSKGELQVVNISSGRRKGVAKVWEKTTYYLCPGIASALSPSFFLPKILNWKKFHSASRVCKFQRTASRTGSCSSSRYVKVVVMRVKL